MLSPLMAKKPPIKSYDETISENGLRFTDQRRAVYDALMDQQDHPTAVELFIRVKGKAPSISLATVYNCLETLTECGLVQTVNHERESARYCPNLSEHAHLFCSGCGGVTDIPLRSKKRAQDIWEFPDNVAITHHEISFRGLCPKCAVTPPPLTK
ncbi:MAG: Fur family transcriptional regulator [Verrucomicrobia bacterium]|nr:Fur family transcriptional regulator [Verrucomicrobiota bacterium]